MIKSMTGFGRFETEENNRKLTVEIKAVNHRYLDVSVRMPKSLNYFESAVRSELKKYVSRGKVDVFISYEDFSEHTCTVRYNRETAREYLTYIRQMAEEFGLNDYEVGAVALSRYPEVFSMEEAGADEEELLKQLQRTVEGAAKLFVESRIAEGGSLREDLLEKLDEMLKLSDLIEERSPQIVAEYRRRLEEKVRELLGDSTVDEARLLTETAIFADRICTDEEIVRLRSHIEATKAALSEGGSIGRKLDFIAQEMNREANTTLSKANDLTVSNYAIELKTQIEKVREQIQNIE